MASLTSDCDVAAVGARLTLARTWSSSVIASAVCPIALSASALNNIMSAKRRSITLEPPKISPDLPILYMWDIGSFEP